MGYKSMLAIDVLLTHSEKRQLAEIRRNGPESMDGQGRIMIPINIEVRVYEERPQLRGIPNSIILYDPFLDRLELAIY